MKKQGGGGTDGKFLPSPRKFPRSAPGRAISLLCVADSYPGGADGKIDISAELMLPGWTKSKNGSIPVAVSFSAASPR